MVIPKIGEAVWLERLASLPPFHAGHQDMVILSPHPDDETLGAGGLLAAQSDRGVKTTVIAVTDGENAYEDFPNLAGIRVAEQEGAVESLAGAKATIVRLRVTDSAVAGSEEEVSEALRQVVTAGTHMVAPWVGDFHPDHEACGRAAAKVAQEKGARLTWYFFWTWHRGDVDVLEGLSLRRFPLSDDLRDRKWAALQQHVSQLSHPSGEPILPDYLLGPARRNFEVFADA